MSNFIINPFRFAGGSPPESGITFIGSASGSDTAALPPHQAGDLILAYSIRPGNISNLPAGWTEIDAWKISNANLGRQIGRAHV